MLYDTIDLAFSATTLAFSGIATIITIVQVARFRNNYIRYTLTTTASLCLLTSSTINIVLNENLGHRTYSTGAARSAAFTLATIVPSLLWVIAIDVFRTLHRPRQDPKEDEGELLPLETCIHRLIAFFAYWWASGIVIIILFTSSTPFLQGVNLFTICIWAFLPMLALQLYAPYSTISHSIKTRQIHVPTYFSWS